MTYRILVLSISLHQLKTGATENAQPENAGLENDG